MYQVLITMHTPREPDQYFIINVPDDKHEATNWHGQYRSLFWFGARERKSANVFNCYNTIKFCTLHYSIETELMFISLFSNKPLIDRSTIPIFNNVFDFYEAINYDIKKKKYRI